MENTFDDLVAQYGLYVKDGAEYCLEQSPYLEYIAGRSTAYVAQGETYYTAFGYDRQGEAYRLWWEITNPETEDESEACDWDKFEAQPMPYSDPAPWSGSFSN